MPDEEPQDDDIVPDNQPLRMDLSILDGIVQKAKENGVSSALMVELNGFLAGITAEMIGLDTNLKRSVDITTYNYVQNTVALGIVRDKLLLDIVSDSKRGIVATQEIVRVVKLMMTLLEKLPQDAKERYSLPPADSEIVKSANVIDTVAIYVDDELDDTDEEIAARKREMKKAEEIAEGELND